MSLTRTRTLSVPEFFAWVVGREGRYELVDGVPVAMAGANRRHDRIVRNGLFLLETRLRARGGPCEPFTADTGIAIPAGNVRFPDLGIDCGSPRESAIAADAPRLVIEVLSPSTAAFDQSEKTAEYKTVPGLDHILLIDPDLPRVDIHRRRASEWISERAAGLEATVLLPALELELPLAELYRGLSFGARPTLVDPN